MTGNMSVIFGFSARFAGATNMAANLRLIQHLSGNLVGNTDLTGFLRINTEVNVFLSGNDIGSTGLTGILINRTIGSAVFAGSTNMAGVVRVLHPDEASLTILADILDTLVAGATGRIRRYDCKFLIDDVQKSIRKAVISAPPEAMGTQLKVWLADPDASLVTYATNITFQIGVWTSSGFIYITLISGGKLSARENPIKNDTGRPADEVMLTIVDVIGNRWNRAPNQPIHLYDSERISAPDQSTLLTQQIQVYGGGTLVPLNIAIPGLTINQVMVEAFVVGTGFSAIMSNLPNFPVIEADFTLTGGYDAGVRPLLSPFSPIFFERNNVLFVIDPDASLPAGFTPRAFPESDIINISDSLPQYEPINAILVQVQIDTGGDYFTERLETETTHTGIFGDAGYLEVDHEQRIREYRNFANPSIILHEDIVNETTRVLSGGVDLIEETVFVQYFDGLNRKTGHLRRSALFLPNMAGIFINSSGKKIIPWSLQDDARRQDQIITYRPNPLNPIEDIQDTVTTMESGLILEDPDNFYTDGHLVQTAFKIPLADAQVSNYLDSNGNQFVHTAEIKTSIESLRVHGDQVTTEVRIINHLAGNVPTQSLNTTRPGGVVVSRKRQQAQRTLMLTTGSGIGGRRTPVLNAGALPVNIAINLGFRKLRQLNNPPKQMELHPAYVDVTIRRGTILAIRGRGGVLLGNYIVLGYEINFDEYNPTTGFLTSMNVQLRQLTT